MILWLVSSDAQLTVHKFIPPINCLSCQASLLTGSKNSFEKEGTKPTTYTFAPRDKCNYQGKPPEIFQLSGCCTCLYQHYFKQVCGHMQRSLRQWVFSIFLHYCCFLQIWLFPHSSASEPLLALCNLFFPLSWLRRAGSSWVPSE